MKAFTKSIKQLILVLTLSTGFIGASPADDESMSPVEQTPVGLRAISEEEKIAMEEESVQEGAVEEEILVSEKYGREAYYPIDYSQISVKEIGARGQSVIMADGSGWLIKPADGYKISNWTDEYSTRMTGRMATQVYITTNDNWFFDRQYDFRMVNKESGESVYCNLTTSPSRESKTWVLNVDSNGGFIEMTNIYGSYVLCYFNPNDSAKYSRWEANDTIIIGRNLRWDSSTNPYILINIETLTSSRASL